MEHLTMDLGNQNLKIILQTDIFFSVILSHTKGKFEKVGQEEMNSSKYFNSNYTEFVPYDICDKLIWTSCEGNRITNKIIK